MTCVSPEFETDVQELDMVNGLTSCPICMEQFVGLVPKVLPCQHTFCLGCLEKHYAATNDQRTFGPTSSFPCPTCRQTYYVTKNGLQDLPTDFKVEQILDLVRMMQDNRKTPAGAVAGENSARTDSGVGTNSASVVRAQSCAVCQCNGIADKPAVKLCIQCSKYFCSQCSENHRKNALFSTHTIVALSIGSTDTRDGWKCDTHHADMTYFCLQCCAPACMLCVTCSHDKHTVLPQQEALQQVRQELSAFSAELTQKAKDVDCVFRMLRNIKEEHMKGYSDSARIIKKAAQEAEYKVKESERQAMSILKTAHNEKLQAITVEEKSFQEQQKSMKNVVGQLFDLSKNKCGKQILIEFESLVIRANSEMKKSTDVSSSLREIPMYKEEISISLGNLEGRHVVVEERGDPQTIIENNRTVSISQRFSELLSNKQNRKSLNPTSSALEKTREFVQGSLESYSESVSAGTVESFRSRSDSHRRQDLIVSLQRQLSIRNGAAQSITTNLRTTSATAQSITTNLHTTSLVAAVINPQPTCTTTVRAASPARQTFPASNRFSFSTKNKQPSATINRLATSTKGNIVISTQATLGSRVTTPVTNTQANKRVTVSARVLAAPIHTTIIEAHSVTRTDSFNCASLWKIETLIRCRGCAFANGDIISVTDFNNSTREGQSRICMFGPMGEQTWLLLRTVESRLIGEPWDICYYPPTSSLLITDHGPNNAIKCVQMSSENVVSVLKCPPMEQPSGIAILNSGDLVISENRSRKKIGVFVTEFDCSTEITNVAGRISRLRDNFGAHGNGEGEVLTVNYVTVDHQDRVIISDSGNRVVKVFSAQGNELLKFSVSVLDGKDMVPQGLAVDEMNNIFVAEHSSNSVLKFSPDGMQIGRPLTMQAQPWGISYCAERKLLAVTTDKVLEVFQLFS